MIVTEETQLLVDPPRLYKRRWFMLIIWLLNYVEMIMIWFAFAPISHQAASYFNRSVSTINLLSQAFMVIEIPMLLVALWLFGRYGLRFGITFTSIMGCIGTWFRLVGVSQQHFEFLIVGQVIAAFGQAFMDSSSTKLAANWFGEHERGTAVGVLICGITIATSGTLYVIPRVITQDYFTLFMFVEAVYATFVLALTAIFFKSAPPTPPSTSLLQKPQADFVYSITRIWLNSGFVLLWLGFGLIMGIYELMITVLNVMVFSQGYSADDSGLFGALVVISGTVGSIIVGVIVDKTKKYKVALISLVSLLVVVFICLYFTMIPHEKIALSFLFVVIGFGIVSSYPAFLESCAEVTFPIPEEYSAALTTIAGNGIGAIGTTITDTKHFQENPRQIAFLFLGMAGLSLLFLIFVKPYYKRYQFEKSGYKSIHQKNKKTSTNEMYRGIQ